ncbi:hypothetical protein SELMODRAFT_131638 [Selaginella moellendorffii]|uniref:Pentacotripeptide-repeat region of PRORP domain-containing protein n=1 Tax=Selaginella moellendorffii TaxID=88036 RepID=D8T470_SELML|nr:hypothetical protein SELMODRAFT_131638 [Selaginella moellendorffii]
MDLFCWASLLSAYTSICRVEEAKLVFDSMPEYDLVCWNSMLAAYAQNGHLENSRQIFLAAEEHNVSPNEVCFVAILVACSQSGAVEDARSHFLSMRIDYGLDPTRKHFSCLIDALGRSGFLTAAEELVTTMPFAPCNLEWKCFLSACNSHRSVDPGAGIASAMLARSAGEDPAASYILVANTIAQEP